MNPETDLQEIVDDFNHAFETWEEFHNHRANFRFSYDGASGRKTMSVDSVSPAEYLPVTIESLVGAEETISEALNEVVEPAESPDPLGLVSEHLQNEVQVRARGELTRSIMTILSHNDTLLLGALGIDGRVKILDLFMEECQTLKEEYIHDPVRAR